MGRTRRILLGAVTAQDLQAVQANMIAAPAVQAIPTCAHAPQELASPAHCANTHSVCIWCEQAGEAPGCGCRRMWRCPGARICGPCDPTCPAAPLHCSAGPCRPACIPNITHTGKTCSKAPHQTQTRNRTARCPYCKRTNSRCSCSADCRATVPKPRCVLKFMANLPPAAARRRNAQCTLPASAANSSGHLQVAHTPDGGMLFCSG